MSEAVQQENLTPLQKAQQRMKEMRANGEMQQAVRLNPVERAQKFPNSPKKAIAAHCWQCCGAGADPGVKQSVRDCKIESCALHPHRPWQKVHGKSADQMTEEEFEFASTGGVDEDHDDDDDVDEESVVSVQEGAHVS